MTVFHDSILSHVRGRSEFIDDKLPQKGELQIALFFSSKARARIRHLNLDAAKNSPGVVGIFTAKDIVHNHWGTIFQDQPLLADKEVNYFGEVIAIIAADTEKNALDARDKIEIEYEELEPILTISQAIEMGEFIGEERKIERGDIESTFHNPVHLLTGKIQIEGADHFYLESQAALAIPKEDGQIEIHSSAQHPTEVQHVVAHAIGRPYKDVVCVVKRMGGAFGGKESQAAPFAAYAGLVAYRTGKSTRLILTKDDDMICTGKRNPFENHYRVAFNGEGTLLALDVMLYSDGGAYADLSTAIMERAMLHCDGAYYIKNVRIRGKVCRTNYHPHTAFRGFGGPKGTATIERIIEEVATALKMDPLDIRKRNVYKNDGIHDTTHYGQKVENNLLPALFESLEKKSEYRRRRQIIQSEVSPNKIRGLSMTAVKFGISFTTRFLNQANALIVIHRDGSVQISTGATEMGQGVNTRIAQVVAESFGISLDTVRVLPTSTDKNANTSPTAASSGTDLNAAAALVAAEKIKERLAQALIQLELVPERKRAKHTAGLGTQPELTIQEEQTKKSQVEFKGGFVHRKGSDFKMAFSDLVLECYLNRISLSDYGYYKIPGLSFNKLTGEGRAFLYFTQGVAASEIEIDTRTGEVKVLRVDILMDLGRHINKELDLGQIYGGFIQGMGWMTSEKLFYSEAGKLLSHSPSTYKIPSIQDTPREFYVDCIENPNNSVNVRGTKAVGEPPLLLSLSIWTAIGDALSRFQGRGRYPRLPIPATNEVIMQNLWPAQFEALEELK